MHSRLYLVVMSLFFCLIVLFYSVFRYTTTPDEHFIICAHPKHPQVTIASPCSGHGFKFCSVVGEILADLATQKSTRHDISLFALDSKRLAEWGHQGYSRL
jgi:sarcosine oxidase